MEKQVIQSVGFRNIKDENGNVTGFQFKVRLPYYRGIFLSQIRPGTLFVDGEKIEKDDIVWNIKGEDFFCYALAPYKRNNTAACAHITGNIFSFNRSKIGKKHRIGTKGMTVRNNNAHIIAKRLYSFIGE